MQLHIPWGWCCASVEWWLVDKWARTGKRATGMGETGNKTINDQILHEKYRLWLQWRLFTFFSTWFHLSCLCVITSPRLADGPSTARAKSSPQADSATCFWHSSHLTTEIVYSCQRTANTLPLLNHNFPITLYSWHKECGVIWEQIRLPHRLHVLLIPFSTSHLRRRPLFFWEI